MTWNVLKIAWKSFLYKKSLSIERLYLCLNRTCDPAGIRTQDPNIKSVMLYQLSYEIGLKPFRLKWRKYRIIELGVQALFEFIF